MITAGCASAPPEGDRIFAFVVDGVTYEIHSARADAMDSANYLLRHDGGTVAFRARDDDKDGTIDLVLKGDLPLEEANRIYVDGIAAAQRRGRVSMREPARMFKVDGPGEQLLVWTVMLGPDRWYNRFARYGTGHAAVLSTDVDADGVLDATDDERLLPDTDQPQYDRTLQLGLRTDRIERVEGRYRVKAGGGQESPPLPPSRL